VFVTEARGGWRLNQKYQAMKERGLSSGVQRRQSRRQVARRLADADAASAGPDERQHRVAA
jgi:hypothetical protein